MPMMGLEIKLTISLVVKVKTTSSFTTIRRKDDRHTDRCTHTQTDAHTHRQTDRQMHTHTDRQTDKQMHTHTDRQIRWKDVSYLSYGDFADTRL